MATRKQIIATARTYAKTPFAHQGRYKGKACDCAGLVLMVAEELGSNDKNGQPVRALEDHRGYGPQPAGCTVLDICKQRMIQKQANEIQAGDVLCLKTPEFPSHVGIVTEFNGTLYLIHAYDGGTRAVTEHILDAKWRERIAGVFQFPGVED
jgi:cell wall-associated NlpC family hydrolase